MIEQPNLNQKLTPKPKSWRWPVWVVLISLVVVALTQHKYFADAISALDRCKWQWLVPAVLLQVLYYGLYAALYWSAFRAVGVESQSRKLLPLVLGSIAVSVAAPGGTAVGAALFVDDAVRRGQSGARAATGTLLVVIAELLGVALISIFGLRLLLVNPELAHKAVIGITILVAITVALIAVIVVGLWKPQAVRSLITTLARFSAWFGNLIKRPSTLDDEWVERETFELVGSAMALRTHPGRVALTFGISMLMFGVLLLSLACLFPAFGIPLGNTHQWSLVSAGFVVGMLFWIVSPTPQGIGVVEAMMAFTYAKLGIPVITATVIAVAFRGLAFWLPLLGGVFCLRTVNDPNPQPGRHRSRSVRVVSVLIGLMGIVNVLSAVHPALPSRFELIREYLPLDITRGSRLASALAGFALMLVARGLWRRKRAAWVLAIAALFISVITHLIKGLDYEEASLAGVLLIWLASMQAKFYAASDPPSTKQGLKVLAAAALFTLAYGVAGLWVLDHYFKENYGFRAAVVQVIAMFTEFSNPGLQPTRTFGIYFRDSIYGVAASTFTYALLMLLRPVLYRTPPTDDDRQRAAAIVAQHGQSPLARYALFEDKSYLFTEGGSVISYAVVGRTAIALGDPIGPPEDVANAIKLFSDYALRNDWRCGFYQTLPDHLEDYTKAGFKSICIGQDAIVKLDEFTVLGGNNKQIRNSLNRFTKQGYRVEVMSPPHREGMIAKLRAVSDDWLADMNSSEKRFSLGWFSEEYVQTCQIMVVLDPDLRVTAFANILPRYGRNESTIDMMRRRRDCENGTMEFLFIKLLEWSRDEGYSHFNLGLSPLSGVGDEREDPAVERALNYVYQHMNQFYSFKGLHTFKSKFHPEWEPRYLVYTSTASLPQLALSIVHANSGGTYLAAAIATLRANLAAKRNKPLMPSAEEPKPAPPVEAG